MSRRKGETTVVGCMLADDKSLVMMVSKEGTKRMGGWVDRTERWQTRESNE